RADELRGRLRLPGLALELVLVVRCDLRKDRGRDEAERSCRQDDSPETSIHHVSLPLSRRFVVARRAHLAHALGRSNDQMTLSRLGCQRITVNGQSASVEEKIGVDGEWHTRIRFAQSTCTHVWLIRFLSDRSERDAKMPHAPARVPS